MSLELGRHSTDFLSGEQDLDDFSSASGGGEYTSHVSHSNNRTPTFFEFLLLSLFSLSTFLGISKLSPRACLKFTKKKMPVMILIKLSVRSPINQNWNLTDMKRKFVIRRKSVQPNLWFITEVYLFDHEELNCTDTEGESEDSIQPKQRRTQSPPSPLQICKYEERTAMVSMSLHFLF